jgi:hypothetical protein
MTVIVVRGGRGSGKTFLIRKVLAHAHRNDPYTEHIDKTLLPQPLPGEEKKAFNLGHILNNGSVFVAGWYDSSASSDPDRYRRRIKQWDSLLFNLLLTKAKEHPHVLFEYIGSSLSDWKLPSSAKGRLQMLANQCDLRIIQLTTSPEKCVASYNARLEQTAREKGRALKPDKVDPVDDYRKSMDSARDLAASGLSVDFVNRNAALKRVMELVGIRSPGD